MSAPDISTPKTRVLAAYPLAVSYRLASHLIHIRDMGAPKRFRVLGWGHNHTHAWRNAATKQKL